MQDRCRALVLYRWLMYLPALNSPRSLPKTMFNSPKTHLLPSNQLCKLSPSMHAICSCHNLLWLQNLGFLGAEWSSFWPTATLFRGLRADTLSSSPLLKEPLRTQFIRPSPLVRSACPWQPRSLGRPSWSPRRLLKNDGVVGQVKWVWEGEGFCISGNILPGRMYLIKSELTYESLPTLMPT